MFDVELTVGGVVLGAVLSIIPTALTSLLVKLADEVFIALAYTVILPSVLTVTADV